MICSLQLSAWTRHEHDVIRQGCWLYNERPDFKDSRLFQLLLQVPEAVYHFLLECSRYDVARRVLVLKLEALNVPVDMATVLGCDDSPFNIKRQILRSLCSFLESTGKVSLLWFHESVQMVVFGMSWLLLTLCNFKCVFYIYLSRHDLPPFKYFCAFYLLGCFLCEIYLV